MNWCWPSLVLSTISLPQINFTWAVNNAIAAEIAACLTAISSHLCILRFVTLLSRYSNFTRETESTRAVYSNKIVALFQGHTLLILKPRIKKPALQV